VAGGFDVAKIRISFVASGLIAAAGSLVLDTTAQQYSDVSVVCTGGYSVAPGVWFQQFEGPGGPYPEGTPTIINIGSQTEGITVQMNYNDHADTDPPIPINGGFVSGVPFDFLIPGGYGATGWVVVTPVPGPGPQPPSGLKGQAEPL
jgi:hypothetical protein